MNAPFMPPKTAASLASPPVNGSRHKTATDEAISLLGNGWSASAVFGQLRQKYPEDVTDAELHDIISWGENKPLAPSIPLNQPRFTRPIIHTPVIKRKTPLEHAEWWLEGKTMDQPTFAALSGVIVPTSPAHALSLALEMLWLGDERLNVVCAFIEDGGKAKPHGAGKVLTRDKWLDYVQTKGVPQTKAGAWVRPNPCKEKGSGAGGAVNDSDIVAWRFLLIESDVLPLPVQLALFSRLKLPIAAVIMSGGISAHAWVKIDAKSAAEFTETARTILVALQPFGIDQANKNPSRLSRLPCAHRTIGAAGGGMQALLWLNSGQSAITKSDLAAFEASLLIPVIENKPFTKIVNDSMLRYQDLLENKGKLGVPTGFEDFDRATGGLMPMQMSVVAGETNAGKSTVGMNIINGALAAGHGVALFTLEMGRDEIADMMFAINCKVDRNHFNTGEFTTREMEMMVGYLATLAAMKLWIFDESLMTADQIRKRILALKAEAKISLAVVDYCQIVAAEQGNNREQEVAAIARTLCATAKDAKIALVVLSQLNDDKRLRESRVIGHEAHNVFLLENKELDNQMIFKVVKGRRIQKRDYSLYYDPLHCRLVSDSKITKKDIPRKQHASD